MNKNIVLLIIATVFLFSGCKKDKINTVTESAVSLRAYPMEPISKDSNGTIIYQLRGSIIAPATFPIIDHGFLIRSSFGFIPVRLGEHKSIGDIKTRFSIPGTITIYSDSLIFYVVLPNGDSIRSDKGLITALPNPSFVMDTLALTTNGQSQVQLTLNVSYNTNLYYISAEEIYYKDPKNTSWLISTINTKPGSLNNFVVMGTNNAISNFVFPVNNACNFQIKITLSPLNGGSGSVSFFSTIQTGLYL